jgi:hypothetical protein
MGTLQDFYLSGTVTQKTRGHTSMLRMEVESNMIVFQWSKTTLHRPRGQRNQLHLLSAIPCRGQEICAPQCAESYAGGSVCSWYSQTKYSPWSSNLGVERGPNEPTPEKFNIAVPWRRPRHTHTRL